MVRLLLTILGHVFLDAPIGSWSGRGSGMPAQLRFFDMSEGVLAIAENGSEVENSSAMQENRVSCALSGT